MEIHPYYWAQDLKTAVESHQAGKPGYIISNSTGKAETHSIIYQSTHSKRLTIAQIVDASKIAFAQLSVSHTEHGMSTHDLILMTTEIKAYTEQLIAARVAKRNHPVKQLLRRVALVFAFLAKSVGINTPFFKLRQKDVEFQREIKALREELQISYDAALSHEAQIIRRLNSIPDVIRISQLEDPDEKKEKALAEQMNSHWKAHVKEAVLDPHVYQFKIDMERDRTFRRKDFALNIEDQENLPHASMDKTEISSSIKLQEATKLLQALIQNKQDKPWELVLQLAVTQNNGLALFQPLINYFKYQSSIPAGQWQVEDKTYAVQCNFSKNKNFPVEIEIIRHPETKVIEKVNVTHAASLDMKEWIVETNREGKLVKEDAIKGKVTYSITLDPKDKHPIFSNFKTEITR